MPYIKPQYRPQLDPLIDQLADKIVAMSKDGVQWETSYAGLLNYACTTLAMKIVQSHFGSLRYGIIATVSGVFSNIASEFYRRVATPYEDMQIKASGDISVYERD